MKNCDKESKNTSRCFRYRKTNTLEDDAALNSSKESSDSMSALLVTSIPYKSSRELKTVEDPSVEHATMLSNGEKCGLTKTRKIENSSPEKIYFPFKITIKDTPPNRDNVKPQPPKNAQNEKQSHSLIKDASVNKK
jgi:hypothetical protein